VTAEAVGTPVVVGIASTPWTTPDACPPQPLADGPEVRIAIAEPYREGLLGLDHVAAVDVVMWFDRSGGYDLVQRSRTHPEWGPRGVFALRTPRRPTPIGVSTVAVVRVEEDALVVRGLDCLDGTPVIDIKPALRR
jgi:tRNA-Thr(GGU) m(6)t(6)A37 methyltransferase TsaA